MSQLIHPSAVGESSEIGPATRMGALEFIANAVKLSSNCVIGPPACIERDAVIGDRVVIQTAAQISAGTLTEERVSIEAYAASALPQNSRWDNEDNNPKTPPSHTLA